MNKVHELYQSARHLLHLGEDGSPIYADDFSRLNSEVFRQAEDLFTSRGSSSTEEAELCVALFMGYNATIYDHGNRESRIQNLLDRSCDILGDLQSSVLKCHLLLYCYGEVYDQELLDQARDIIVSWGGRELAADEQEMMEFYNELLLSTNTNKNL